jgi:hypothetical protein
MTQRNGHVYLCHALRLVHALRRGLLVGGHSGFYMGNLVHREDAKLVTCLEGIFTFSEIAEKGVKYINPLICLPQTSRGHFRRHCPSVGDWIGSVNRISDSDYFRIVCHPTGTRVRSSVYLLW